MSMKKPLIQMLRQLLKEMEIVTSQGAGYYTCVPFARRFNKLLGESRKLFADQEGIIATFETMDEMDPKDPGEKSKVLLGIRVETSQLITLLETTFEDSAE